MADIVELVGEVIKEVGATSPKEMGKVMSRLMPQVRGKAEGSEVSRIVTKLLSE